MSGADKRLSRRKFLTTVSTAAGALAVPCFIPARALGRGGAVAPSERILLGGIGMGGRGSSDLGWMMAEPDVQFVAVCDIRRSQREAVKRTVDNAYGNRDCAVYGDIRRFLAERTDIDAVLIATGDRWHAPASILAMQAGKDVYCEKPSCFTMAQGRQVVETARKCGRVYQTGTQRLSEAHHVFGMEMARSGRLGKVHTVYADIRYRGGSRHDWLPAEPEPPRDELDWDAWLGPCPWRPYNQAYVRQQWYDFYDFATDTAMWGAHTIAQALAGIEVSRAGPVDLEFQSPGSSIVVRFADGLRMVLVRGGDCWKDNEYWHGACGERFDGPEGWVAAADGYSKPDVSSPALLTEYKKVMGEYTARTQRPMNHARDFFDCVKSRRPTVANPEVMCTSMHLSLAADVCDLLRRNLKLDLARAEFIGDPEANRFRSRAMRESWTI